MHTKYEVGFKFKDKSGNECIIIEVYLYKNVFDIFDYKGVWEYKVLKNKQKITITESKTNELKIDNYEKDIS